MNKTQDYSRIRLKNSEVYEIHKWTHNCVIEKFSNHSMIETIEILSQPFESALNTEWQMSVTSRLLSKGNRTFHLFVENMNQSSGDTPSAAESVRCYVYVVDIYGREVRIAAQEISPRNKSTKLFECEMSSVFDHKFGFVSGAGRIHVVLKFIIKGQKRRSFDRRGDSLKLSMDSIIPVFDSNRVRKTTKNNSRIAFIVNERQFSVDKCLVSTKSVVFAQLFADNKHLNAFRLTDIRGEVFEDLLHFINTGTVHNLKENRIDLLIAANKYRFVELEDLCLESIVKDMSVDNVIKHLKLAKANRIESLMKKALLFIDKNYSQLRETKDWKQNFNFVLKVGQTFVTKY